MTLQIMPDLRRKGNGSRDECPIAARHRGRDDVGMKRLVASVLWFYCGWYAGSLAAALIGTPDLGLIVGIAAGLFVGLDPRHLIWTRTPSREATTASSGAGASAPTAA
jgi:hypothetical protein